MSEMNPYLIHLIAWLLVFWLGGQFVIVADKHFTADRNFQGMSFLVWAIAAAVALIWIIVSACHIGAHK